MSDGANIRAIDEADWPAIERIQRACYPPSAVESLESLRSIAEISPELCLAATSASGVCAYLLAHPWRDDDLPALDVPLDRIPEGSATLFVHDLALLPSARGGGLADRMVRRMLSSAMESGLRRGSLLSVQGTVGFWRRFGFLERPDLTARFQTRVLGFYRIGFAFMTAESLSPEV